MAARDPRLQLVLDRIRSSLWAELGKPAALEEHRNERSSNMGKGACKKKTPSDEKGFFWAALQETEDDRRLASEALRCVAEDYGQGHPWRKEFAGPMRHFFSADREHVLFRPLAIELGYLPSDVEVVIQGGTQVVVRSILTAHEGLQSVVDDLRNIRGDDRRTRRR